ncbi:hypothetical protein PHYBLDRAFT_94450, partial [Phycomyces blakesleeanus NRRL 1555(-)]
DKRMAQQIISKLMLHDASPLFNEPVDTTLIPDYRKIVRTPMDLRTINEKLESGKYTSVYQMDVDIRLVFSNCFAYNSSGTYAYEQ